jgi:chromosome partitioning protein
MPLIAFVNQKGGCAKSTTAVHFAYWLQEKKKQSVLVVDADAQRSSSIWLGGLEHRISSEVIQTADDLLEQLPSLAERAQYLVVDGPAGLSEAIRAILFRCDVAVVPCQPTGVDLRSASDAIRLIKQAQSVRHGQPTAGVFLSRAIKGTKLKSEAITLLSKSPEVKTLKSVIHQRQIVADTFGQAATVWDLPGTPASDTAKEYEQLFEEIMELLTCHQTNASLSMSH